MQSESTLSLRASRRAALPIFLLVLVATLSHFAVAQTATQIPPQVSNGTAKLLQPVSPTQMLRVVLGMERPHAAAEEQFLADLHTKGTKDYRNFLKPEEWNARFGPSKADEQVVVDWAKSQGLTVTARFPHRLIVDLEGPVSVIEKAFNVKINNYQIGTSIRFSNDREPQIKGSAASLVHSIGGLNDIQRLQPASHGLEPDMPIYSPGPVKGTMATGHANGDHKKFLAAMKASKDKKEKKGRPGITNGFYDPTDLYGSNAYDFNALYAQGHCCNPFGNPGGTPPVTSIAIAMAGSTNGNDFVGFQAQYSYLAYHYFTIPIDGNPPCCSQEGTLDFEWSMAMSNSFGAFTDTSSIFLYQGVNNNLSTFTDIWSHMLADGNARTMNVSYGCAEFSCYDNGTMDTDHGIFNSMVGQGWSLVASSGDQGATADCNTISVGYPSSDPDIVSTGGTTLSLNSDSTYFSEVAWTGGTQQGSCQPPTNNGGGGGGCSSKFGAPGYQSGLPQCVGQRSVPDISLNAASGQNYFYNGGLGGVGGTSIAAPEVSGFFAQENAYLYYLNGAIIGNSCGNGSCAPMGNPNWYMYYEGLNAPYAGHYPFYDITSGCNSNDVTIAKNLTAWCAYGGYDLATGWGSFNALQMAWSINTYLAGDFGGPVATFTGPSTGVWYNTNQIVSWFMTDTSGNGRPANGIAGFSQAWDVDPGDSYSQATPGQGDSFFSGPEFPNSTTGCLSLTGAGGCSGGVSQGCHTAYVRSWDNAGWDGLQTYGSLCYDTIPPVTTSSQSPGPNANGWNNTSVQVSLAATDPGAGSTGSGVQGSYYAVDNSSCSYSNLGACFVYGSPINVTTEGSHNVYDFSGDIAGNGEPDHSVPVNIDLTAPVTGASFSGKAPVVVTLSASDNLSGVASTVYRLDGGALVNYTGPFIVVVAGQHTIAFSSTDLAGNAEKTKSSGFKVLGSSTTALVSSLNPSTYGQAVTFTAAVTPSTATGTVTFKNGSVTLGTVALAAGKAKFTTAKLTAGSNSIVAIYGGNASFGGSTSPAVHQTVQKAATTTTLVSSLNPSKKGQAVTLTATMAPGVGVTGTVTFKNGTVVLGTAAVNTTTHKAAITRSTLTVGTHSITAVYGGNANFNASTSAVLKQVVH